MRPPHLIGRSPKRRLNLAVIGVGHLGKEHTRILKTKDLRLKSQVNLVGVVDTNRARARQLGALYRVPYYFDYRQIMDKVDAVSIVTPTISHYSIARDFINRGIHTFIEKPITRTVAQAKRLVACARRKRVVLQVGHIERFNPAFAAIRPYVRYPRFIECHRLAPFSFRSVDIDVILDLMIHDIDIILALVNSRLTRIDAVGVNILSDKKDIANVRLLFQNGCVANITASRVSDKSMRKLRVFSRDSYISVDYLARMVRIYRKPARLPASKKLLTQLAPGQMKDPKELMKMKLLQVKEIKIKKYEPLHKELVSFVECIRKRNVPVVTGEDALRALDTAYKILNKMNR